MKRKDDVKVREWRKLRIILASLVVSLILLYLAGAAAKLSEASARGFFDGESLPSLSFSACLAAAFTARGMRAVFLMGCIGSCAAGWVYLESGRNGTKDERGFSGSGSGLFGTAGWMSDGDIRDVLEEGSPGAVRGTILGERGGKVVCMPEDTMLNRHIAIIGASGTMKSRAVIRNALFQAMKRGESVIVTDSKAELYADTADMFEKAGYEVRVLNLVSPDISDSFNCMSGLGGDSLTAQMITNVIIGNTTNGKGGDPFWDNGDTNLLKALILLIDTDASRREDAKNLHTVYRKLIESGPKELEAEFRRAAAQARDPFNIYNQATDTIKASIRMGLSTRLQILQNERIRGLLTGNDISLTMPAEKKCAYFLVLSDQDATMAFLSSLFFTCLFSALTRHADMSDTGKCRVPVNIILDEFNNIGRIGTAPDGSDFARSLSVIRSRDIRVMIAVQSLGQLQNRYPNNLWAEIIGNCDIQLMLGCTDDITAKYISVRSGEMTVRTQTHMTVRKTFALAQIIPQYRLSEGEGRRFLLTQNEVLKLPRNELLCLIRGCDILRLEKFDYTRHPYAQRIKKRHVRDYVPVRLRYAYPGPHARVPAATEAFPAMPAGTPGKDRTEPDDNIRASGRRFRQI